MQGIHLSERTRCVARMVTPRSCVCDVGCDHGFVSIYLVQNKLADRVIAMDIGEGPLARAREHIERYGLADRIETRLSDGLGAIGEEEDIGCVIMAGMGGPLMERIMREGAQRGLSVDEFVLQPQSRQDQLRTFLRTDSYGIVQEDMILEDGKFYPVMKVRPPKTPCDTDRKTEEDAATCDVAVCDHFGPLLLAQRHPVLRVYLERQREKFLSVRESCLQKGADTSDVDRQLFLVEKGFEYFM